MATSGRDELAAARDQMAARWDDLFGSGNPAAAAIRERYFTEATNRFGPGTWILNLGCGTGEDAVALASQGVRVWALDWSPRLLAATEARASAAGVSERVITRRLAPSQAGLLLEDGVPPERIDGVLAPWGALNLEADLPATFDALYRLMRPSALLVAGLLNRRSLFGAMGAVADGRVGEGLRRLRGADDAPQSWSVAADLPALPVHLPSEAELKAIYGTRFALERAEPLGLLTPPAGEGRLGGRAGGLLGRLGRVERALSALPPMRTFSDQTLLVVRRTIEGMWGPAGPHYLAN